MVHLVDGTYEIFRQYYAPRPGHLDSDGIEIGATRGVVQSVFTMLQDGATHLGVATDHVIESFRKVDDWQWTCPTEDFPVWCKRFGWPRIANEAAALATARKP